jgi:hypothetical protein
MWKHDRFDNSSITLDNRYAYNGRFVAGYPKNLNLTWFTIGGIWKKKQQIRQIFWVSRIKLHPIRAVSSRAILKMRVTPISSYFFLNDFWKAVSITTDIASFQVVFVLGHPEYFFIFLFRWVKIIQNRLAYSILIIALDPIHIRGNLKKKCCNKIIIYC